MPDNVTRSERRVVGNGLPTRPSLNVALNSGPPPDKLRDAPPPQSLSSQQFDVGLQPPPSRAAVFGGFAYPGSETEHDLPRVRSSQSLPDATPPPPNRSPTPKTSQLHQRTRSSTVGQEIEPSSKSAHNNKTKIFGWFKSSKSGAPSPSSQQTRSNLSRGSQSDSSQISSPRTVHQSSPRKEDDLDSFKVKGFRQVRPASPPTLPYPSGLGSTTNFSQSVTSSPYHVSSPNVSSSRTSLDTPRPLGRPRGGSASSESSQKVTVAAFRQAQARRSSTHLSNSPILGPSDGPVLSRTSLTLDLDLPLSRSTTPSRLGLNAETSSLVSSPRLSTITLFDKPSGSASSAATPKASTNSLRRMSLTQSEEKENDHQEWQVTITSRNVGAATSRLSPPSSSDTQKARSQPSSPVIRSPPSPTRSSRAFRSPPSASALLGSPVSSVSNSDTSNQPTKSSHSQNPSMSTVTDRNAGERSRATSSLANYSRSQASKSSPVLGTLSSGGISNNKVLPGGSRPSLFANQSDTSDEEDTEADSDDEDGEEDEDTPLSSLAGPTKRPGTSMSSLSVSTTKQATTARPPARKRSVAGSSQVTARPSSSLAKVTPGVRSSSLPLGLPISSSRSEVGVPSSGLRRPGGGAGTGVVSPRSVSSGTVGASLPGSKQPSGHKSQPSLTPSAARPFSHAFRQNNSHFDSSPASSIGDSSSGKFPVTPRDGSEPSLGSGSAYLMNGGGVKGRGGSENRVTPGGAASSLRTSTVGGGGGGTGGAIGLPRPKRPSVSFEVPEKDSKSFLSQTSSGGGGDVVKKDVAKDPEVQRRDRRRIEAKAAIELGNLVNGPPPIIADHDDAIGNLGGGIMASQQQAWEAWQSQARMSQAMFMNPNPTAAFGIPQFPSPTPAGGAPDAAFFAAHQQAMLIAKQTYQYAVAQQALAAANDEWERSSSATAAFGMQGSVMGSPSLMGGSPGGGGGMMPMQMGMGMGMGMGMSLFPPAPTSMYGGGGGGSVLGGSSNWGSASVYGGSFGPSTPGGARRTSGVAFPGGGGGSGGSELGGGLPRPRPRTRTAPSTQSPPGARPTQMRQSSAAPSSWRAH